MGSLNPGAEVGRSTGFLRAVMDAMPSAIFIVDVDVRILDCNLAASRLLAAEKPVILRRRGGEVLHCIQASGTAGGCGGALACRDCVIRNAVREAIHGGVTTRKAQRMRVEHGEKVEEVHMLVTAAPIPYEASSLVLLILEDVSELINLRRILPICAGCRKIRNDQEYWQQVDEYFRQRFDIDFSHGICPECAARLYPEARPEPEADTGGARGSGRSTSCGTIRLERFCDAGEGPIIFDPTLRNDGSRLKQRWCASLRRFRPVDDS